MKATRYLTATSTYAKLLKTRVAMGSIPGQGNQSGIHEEAFFTAEARPLIIDREQGGPDDIYSSS
jgi:hypothetical protein